MFEINKTVIQLLKHRDNYEKLKSVVNKRLFDTDTRRILNTLDLYWANYPDHKVVSPDVFMSEIILNNPDLSDSDMTLCKGIVSVMLQDADEHSSRGILRSLRTLDFADKLRKVQESYQTGLDIDLYTNVGSLLDRFEHDIKRDDTDVIERADFQDILAEESSGTTIPWFLECLRGSMPDVHPGMQIIFAARPGTGKTSFCARDAVYKATRIPDSRPVLWVNNEGKGIRILGTLYRAALGKTLKQLGELGHEKAQKMYHEAIGGEDKIQVANVQGRDYKFLERLFSKIKPAVVYFDMLDNVHGFSGSERNDLKIEQLYQWAREQAVLHDFLSIPTSQIDAKGEGLAWPDKSMLKDSKTGKQGACDSIIMMGATNNTNQLWSRFIRITKLHKGRSMPGVRPDCAKEVQFNGQTCQFIEPEITDIDV